MRNILFVCLGNICRSPMAEFILKDIVNRNEIADGFHIESCGVSDEEFGEMMDWRATETLNKYGIPNNKRTSWKIRKEDYNRFDEIYVMESYQKSRIEQICGPDFENKIKTLLPYDIEDPWYTGNFDKVYGEIVEGCEKIVG